MTAMLEATALVKRFGATVALDGFDLRVSAGEIAGLVGHNGAGKTTFARVTAGLITPDSGLVRVAGMAVSRSRARVRPLLGLAPQELALYPTATARENLYVFAGLYGMRRGEARHRIDQLADALVLSEVLDRRVRDLSGGQQRRLQAATAMLHRPRLLLLDEPTVGADPVTRDALLAAVRAVAADGAAVVYTTHYLPELDTLNATLAVADHGRVVARGDRAELLATVPGQAVVDFDEPPPPVAAPPGSGVEIRREGRRLTITAREPAAVLAPLLAAHPGAAAHLRAIELRPPTLDDLYRRLVSA
jgi:ABC-2 type transport system ATP-binding protein